MQHLTGVLVEGRIEPGKTIAHRRTLAARPDKPHPGDRAYDGTPTSQWPNCMPSPAQYPKPNPWREYSAGRALELGAVPCTHSACAEAVTR